MSNFRSSPEARQAAYQQSRTASDAAFAAATRTSGMVLAMEDAIGIHVPARGQHSTNRERAAFLRSAAADHLEHAKQLAALANAFADSIDEAP